MLFLMACSAAYEQVKEIDIKNPKTFQQHLLYNYKENASFEAEKISSRVFGFNFTSGFSNNT